MNEKENVKAILLKKMTMLLKRLIEKNNTAFRIYADVYHMMVSLKNKICRNRNSENKQSNVEQIETLRKMVSIAEKENRKIYGKAIIDKYDDNKKTALLVSHEFSFTGAPIALLSFAEVLLKKGLQVVMISPDDRGLGRIAEERGIPAVVYEDLYRSDIVLEIVKLFDLVVANTAASAPVICRIDGTDSPVIWWIHEAKTFYICSSARKMPRSVKGNIHIYCVGKYAQRMLESRFSRYKTKQLIYCANDISLVDSGDVSDFKKCVVNKTVFACVGTIEYRKGQDILLKAIELLDEEIRDDCEFVFVGVASNNNIKNSIVEMEKEYPKQIKYYEGLPPKELYEIYRMMDYIICASRDDPMPLVIAEAMTLCKPCICSCNTGSADIINKYDSGYVYEDDDPAKLAGLITKACTIKGEEYRRISGNARKGFEEEYSEKVFEKNVTEIIDNIM